MAEPRQSVHITRARASLQAQHRTAPTSCIHLLRESCLLLWRTTQVALQGASILHATPSKLRALHGKWPVACQVARFVALQAQLVIIASGRVIARHAAAFDGLDTTPVARPADLMQRILHNFRLRRCRHRAACCLPLLLCGAVLAVLGSNLLASPVRLLLAHGIETRLVTACAARIRPAGRLIANLEDVARSAANDAEVDFAVLATRARLETRPTTRAAGTTLDGATKAILGLCFVRATHDSQRLRSTRTPERAGDVRPHNFALRHALPLRRT